MGAATCIKRAAEIVAASAKERAVVVVVSAMGGVTNRLFAAAQSSVEGDPHASEKLADELRRQHFDCVDLLVADDQKRSELKNEIENIIHEGANFCRELKQEKEF